MLKLPRPCLALVTSQQRSARPLAQAVAEAVAAGVDLVQLREPGATPAAALALGHQLRAITAGRALLIVNGAAEVARAIGADGLHLPEAGPPLAEVRDLLGPAALIGRSVHSVGAASAAFAEGADYVQVGAIFATDSHPGEVPAGPALLRAVRAAIGDGWVLAVGGITPANCAEALAAGADGVAVIGAILASDDPGAAARALRVALDREAARSL